MINMPSRFGLVLMILILAISMGVFFIATKLEMSGAYMTAYIVLYLVISIIFLWAYQKITPLDIFSPAPMMIILLFLYSIASALYAESFGETNYGHPVSRHLMELYYFYCLVGLVSLVAGFLVARQRKMQFITLRHWIGDTTFFKKILFYGVAIAILLFPLIWRQFNFMHVQSYSERALPMRLEYMSSERSGLIEALLVAAPVNLILCIATLFIFRQRSMWIKILGGVVFLSYFAANTLAGWRSLVVAALTIPAIFCHYRIRRFSTIIGVIGAVVIYIFVNWLAMVRHTSDPREMLGLTREDISNRGFEFASLKSANELKVAMNFMRLISGIENHQTEYTYGSSIATELLVLVPRALYPQRPLPLSERFLVIFYPGVREAGGGYGAFILQEGYWSFGLLGIVIFMFFYGWSLELIYQWFMINMRYDIVALLYALSYTPLVLNAVRSGIILNYKTAMMNVLPLLLILILPWPRKISAQ